MKQYTYSKDLSGDHILAYGESTNHKRRLATEADLAEMGLCKVEMQEPFISPGNLIGGSDAPHMQHQFKVGDKVRLVKKTYSQAFPLGAVGKITRIYGYTFDGDIEMEGENCSQTCAYDDIELVSSPQHVWEVGQYALYKKETVCKVVTLHPYLLILTTGRLTFCTGKLNLTPCEKPARPELNKLFDINFEGKLCLAERTTMSLSAWIKAIEEDPKSWWHDLLEQLLALRDWRELTGEV